MAFVVMVVAVSIYQEHKAERALAALRDLSSPRALVVRDGPRCASRVARWCLAMHMQPAYLVPRGSARGGGLR